ncbi:uncharacterized protein [Amphiura filiformis]|uniref:uncharacterized protein isoform X1 n=1 Tax=Amphiura filiformis TaxID=82378 RepID=UPI003B21175E
MIFLEFLTIFVIGMFVSRVENHVCLLIKRPDPANNGVLRWSMYQSDICYCQKVYLVTDVSLPGCTQPAPIDLWYVESSEAELLTLSDNWTQDVLDRLLNRTICYEPSSTSTETMASTSAPLQTTDYTTNDLTTIQESTADTTLVETTAVDTTPVTSAAQSTAAESTAAETTIAFTTAADTTVAASTSADTTILPATTEHMTTMTYTTTTEPDDGPKCASNWTPYGEYCYYVNNQVVYTYEQARINCLKENATLTSVLSTEEQAFHEEFVAIHNVALWIGFNDIQTDSIWIWEDGSQNPFTAWIPGEPNGAGAENCAHLTLSGRWNDKSCTHPLGYICKRPKGCAAN